MRNVFLSLLFLASVSALAAGTSTHQGYGTWTGNLVGNASTASALYGSPTACTTSEWSTGIASNGNSSCSQPNFSDISGTLAAAQLPNPTATSLGGVQSFAKISNSFINSISPSGVPSAGPVSCSTLTNSVSSCSIDATNAANISSGILPNARMPSPTATSLGGVESLTCSGGQFLQTIGTSGVPTCATPAGGGTVTDVFGTYPVAVASPTTTPYVSVTAVNASYTSTGGPSIGTSPGLLGFDTKVFDSNNAYSTGSGLFTSPVAGKYLFCAVITLNSSATTAEIQIYKNGSFDAELDQRVSPLTSNLRASGCALVSVALNDTLALYASANTSDTLYTASGFSHIDITWVGN